MALTRRKEGRRADTSVILPAASFTDKATPMEKKGRTGNRQYGGGPGTFEMRLEGGFMVGYWVVGGRGVGVRRFISMGKRNNNKGKGELKKRIEWNVQKKIIFSAQPAIQVPRHRSLSGTWRTS